MHVINTIKYFLHVMNLMHHNTSLSFLIKLWTWNISLIY